MLRPGHITVTIGKRVAPDDMSWGADARERTKTFHKFYEKWYADMCYRLETEYDDIPDNLKVIKES